MIEGRKTTLRTDHKPLTYMFTLKSEKTIDRQGPKTFKYGSKIIRCSFQKIKRKKKRNSRITFKNNDTWLSKPKVDLPLNHIDPDNHISLPISSKLVELEENQVEKLQTLVDYPHNIKDPKQKKNLDLEVEVQNKTSEVIFLNPATKQTDGNNDIQFLSDAISQPEPTPLISLLESPCEIKLSENFDFEDPVTWPLINDKFRKFIVEHGPKLETYKNYNFPLDETSRHFHEKWLFRTLPNGEEVRRACISLGFNNWKKLNPKISDHEKSPSHKESVFKWKEFEKRLHGGKTIDCTLQNAIKSEKEKWKAILKILFDVILFCAKNNLALRGTDERIGKPNCGIFLSTLELLSHYNPILAKHIEEVNAKNNVISYFSPQIQNEIISLLGKSTREKLLNRVKESKYYSIMFDCTPDVSHKEQMSQVLRYVYISNGTVSVEETFIDFMESHEKTGEGLSLEIIEKLNKDDLKLSNCRGQSYDNASNMSGKYKGVKTRIMQINNLAVYVPCNAHSLNLVGDDAAKVCVRMITFFDTVQQIFIFFSSSTSRWTTLMKCINISLKCTSATRWSAKQDSVSALKRNLKNVYNVLKEMSENPKLPKEVILGATNLLKHLDFNFFCLLDLWNEILTTINRVNLALQKKSLTIDSATKMVKGLILSVQTMRNEGIEKTIEFSKVIANDLGIKANFSDKRKRKVKKLDFEIIEDNVQVLSQQNEFKKDIFEVYDRILTELSNRFENMSEINENFGFLYGSSLTDHSMDYIQKCAADLSLKYKTDLNSSDFISEIKDFKSQAFSLLPDLRAATPLALLQLITTYSLRAEYPNVEIALRIFLTLPITVATCERSFSKLKLIKNYLRSTMGQDRISDMAILSIEHTVVNTLDINKLIEDFAGKKARKIAI
ncbi:zinc finger MYM-type protein 1-like [Metopolophium dirhodum]|uniref:zinc finger MYM-type protein 1-like n=1 Tax=Metopolophium dirhodum TaxID=44670 RepID=UPI0029903C7D|nr:zinc finger MYM-type protein 1-like [Metopolophium dirhodum]